MTVTSSAASGPDAAPRERGEHYRLLYECALAFAEPADLDGLLRAVVERGCTLLMAVDAALWVGVVGVVLLFGALLLRLAFHCCTPI